MMVQDHPLSTVNKAVQATLSDIKAALEPTKRKSTGIRLLVERISSILAQYQEGKNIIPSIIHLLSVLKAAVDAPDERRNRGTLEKALALAYHVLKQLGAEPLAVGPGDRFDPHLHCAIDVKIADLPDRTIYEVLSPGVRIGAGIYPAQVVVVRNSQQDEGAQQQEASRLQDGSRVPEQDHASYQEIVQELVRKVASVHHGQEWLTAYHESLLCVFLLNLDPIRDRMVRLYSTSKRGCPPYNPLALFRSLIVMTLFHETSVTRWAVRLKTEPWLAIISGFRPQKVPAVGTYYHLFERLENGPYQPKCHHRILPSVQRRARLRVRFRNEKPLLPPKEPAPEGVLQKLVEKLKAQEGEPLPGDLEKRLNELLLHVAVIPSANRGLLGEVEKLTLAGDGSTVPSGAAHEGKATCDCRRQGIYHCDHLRKFSDPDAAWGWDNREKDFVFGYRYYQLVSAEKQHDLPVHLSIGPANTHEAVMSLCLLDRFTKQNRTGFPTAHLYRLALDSIHDAYAFYRYLAHQKIGYAIPYAHAPAQCVALGQDGQLFTDTGVPLCPAGLPMLAHGADRQGNQMFHCPAKRPTHQDGKYVYLTRREKCSREALCEPHSALGPWVHVKKGIDPRIHPAIPRGSKEYYEVLRMRTCCERSNATKKTTFGMKQNKMRVMPYVFIRLMVISLVEHARVWVAEKLKGMEASFKNILALFT